MQCLHHSCILHQDSETLSDVQKSLLAASTVSLHCDLLTRVGEIDGEDAAEIATEFNCHREDSLLWDIVDDGHHSTCETVKLVHRLFDEMSFPVEGLKSSPRSR